MVRDGDVVTSMEVGLRSFNTTRGIRIDQKIILKNISVAVSGEYHCRVATFFEEFVHSLSLTVFGKEESDFI